MLANSGEAGNQRDEKQRNLALCDSQETAAEEESSSVRQERRLVLSRRENVQSVTKLARSFRNSSSRD